jgi:molybdopterin molybdotransferase
MTGAAVPAGCDAVVPVEETSGFSEPAVHVFAAVAPGQHVAARGSERRAGALAAAAGQRLRRSDIGQLAAVGATTVCVGRRPRIAILSTGNELVPHGATPGDWSIRDSNAPLLAALAAAYSDRVEVLEPVPDDRARIAAAIGRGLAADVLVMTGGMSMGAYDWVGPVLAEAGVQLRFRRVLLQPGKPSGFGTHAGGCVLALPGNPVSALTTFRLFAATALRRLEGESECRPRFAPAPAQFAWQRRNPKWLLVPGRMTAAGVERVDYRGSGDLAAYVEADCQIVLDDGIDAVEPGMWVPVWRLD